MPKKEGPPIVGLLDRAEGGERMGGVQYGDVESNTVIQAEREFNCCSRVLEFILVFVSWLVFLPTFFCWLRVVREYERAVVFRLGRVVAARGPGIIYVLPLVDRYVKVDLRTKAVNIPRQECITKDSVTLAVDACVYYHCHDPLAAVNNVERWMQATLMLASTTLRNTVGQSELDDLLKHRDHINSTMRQTLDRETEAWGVAVTNVDLRDITLPTTMQRAMASEAEAERQRRAKVIAAQGEFEASQRLTEAARTMAQEPIALQIRYLQTLQQIGEEQATMIAFPLPIDVFSSVRTLTGATQQPIRQPILEAAGEMRREEMAQV